MNLKNPINKFKSMIEAELNIRNKTCEERGLVIDKLKEDIVNKELDLDNSEKNSEICEVEE